MPTPAVPRGTFVGKGFPTWLDNYSFFPRPLETAMRLLSAMRPNYIALFLVFCCLLVIPTSHTTAAPAESQERALSHPQQCPGSADHLTLSFA
jgi:hypothetical protein